MMMDKKNDIERIKIIYIGRRLSSKDKIIHSYLKGDEIMSFSKRILAASIGSEIEVTKYNEDTIQAPYKWIGKTNDKRLSNWIAQDKADSDLKMSMSNMKKVDNVVYENHLQGIRLIYYSLNSQQRLPFVLRLLKDLDKSL